MTHEDDLDEGRLSAEWEGDIEVLKSLRRNGDDARITRPVDVRFVGPAENIQAFAKAAAGWEVIQIVDLGDELALDVRRNQTTEDSAIRALTVDALAEEKKRGVRYDGWGTVAQKKKRWFGL